MKIRTVPYETIATAVEKLCIDCCYELPEDVLLALRTAAKNESDPRPKRILDQLIENAHIAKTDRIPLCQDTGLAIIFVTQGTNAVISPPADNLNATLANAVNAGVTAGYQNGLLRKSVVAEPLNHRQNTNTNTPAVIHLTQAPGDKIAITVMTKGGGCENKSQFKMFNPTESKDAVTDWIVSVVTEAGANACPPFVIGVGIGGDFEQCCMISKKALLRKLDEPSDDAFYAQMENDLLQKINATGLGPQGLGGNTTALGVKIETAPCHIASLPVAVNIECHSHRHKSIIL